MDLKDIKSPADIKCMSPDELSRLADELRGVLLEKLAACGGHVGPNLGFLESTIALHYVFNAPTDKIVFDVSHQTYVHKMLTGRIAAFLYPEHYGDVTGYTNPHESKYDLFSIGHTSTSVSLASGLAKARDLRGEHHAVVAVIGDGSLSGGEAFEGLDYAAKLGTPFIVVVNDNQMSIAENYGGLYDNLAELRRSGGKSEDNYFRSLGFDYIYVSQGNDVLSLIGAFEKASQSSRPIVVHINTDKGHGYAPAEEHKEAFHYHGPFDLATGRSEGSGGGDDYTDIFAKYMLERMVSDPTVAVITAGTPAAIGFGPDRREKAGHQFIDVGIAEEQAVAMASGLARGGCKPVFADPATFLQRTYDQLSQDVSINQTAATFVTFYGGVWGMADETHLGFFDVPMIANIPGLLMLAPTCREEYLAMLEWSLGQTERPVVVRTPGAAPVSRRGDFAVDYSTAGYETVKEGEDGAIIAAGDFLPLGLAAAERLADRGIHVRVINPRCVSQLDTATLDSLRNYSRIVTLEDNSVDGGLGQKIAAYLGDAPVKVSVLGLPKRFENRFKAAELLKQCGLTPEGIASLF